MKTYPIDTDSREHAGYTLNLEWFSDECHGAPWEEEDGHGPVSEWTSRDKRPGERVLNKDRSSARYYDFAEAMDTARRDGWGLAEDDIAKLAARLGRTPTQGDITAEAVERDFKWLRDWCNDVWHYVGYSMTVTSPEGDDVPIAMDSLWGIDSPSMKDFAAEAFENAIDWIDREIIAESDAACRDIATV